MKREEFDSRSAWEEGADAYIHFLESGADYYRHLVHGPGLLKACGDVHGLHALDLGCGQGYFCRLLAQHGAAVTGVDIAEPLIHRARELEAEQPIGITYYLLDAATIGNVFVGKQFDLVTGCMSIQDFSDPQKVLQAARSLLKQSGHCIFSLPHPGTDTPVREWKRDANGNKITLGLDRYFDSGVAICDWNMARLKYAWSTPYHRFTLTEWSMLISESGFVIRALSEPRPSADDIARQPDLEDCDRMPYFLVFDLSPA